MTFATQATTPGSAIWLRDVSGRDLGHVALRVDRPLHHEVSLDARVRRRRRVVAGARLVPVCHDDGPDVRRSAPGSCVCGPLVGAGAELPVVDATVVVCVELGALQVAARAQCRGRGRRRPGVERRAARWNRPSTAGRSPKRTRGSRPAGLGGSAAARERDAEGGHEESEGDERSHAANVAQLGARIRPCPSLDGAAPAWFALVRRVRASQRRAGAAAQARATRRLRASPRARLRRDGDGAPRARHRPPPGTAARRREAAAPPPAGRQDLPHDARRRGAPRLGHRPPQRRQGARARLRRRNAVHRHGLRRGNVARRAAPRALGHRARHRRPRRRSHHPRRAARAFTPPTS